MSRSAKSGSQSRENANQPNPTHPELVAIIHPTHNNIHHLLSKYLEGKPGGSPPVSCRCIFYRAFRGLQHALADIYLYIFWLLLRFRLFFYIIPSSPFICLHSFFIFFLLVVRVEREYLTGPIRYPHTLFVSFVRQPFSALRSPLHAYHSLLVWPLYQQPLSFARPLPTSRSFPASSSDCNVNS